MRISDWSSDLCSSYLKSSAFGIVVFSDETDLPLAEVRLAGNAEAAGILRRRMESRKTRITHAGLLTDILDELEAGPSRNSWKRLILVAPRLAFLDKLMARGWQIGRAHVLTPVTNAHLVCRLLLAKKKTQSLLLHD